MRIDEVTPDISGLAFEFFYWFSRFEFCLKENHYLRHENDGDIAEPGWNKFVDRYFNQYIPSLEAQELIASPPERQIVRGNGTLDWTPVGLADCKSDLAMVARLVKTVRNNLFHGGKHGGTGWDDPARTQQLLTSSKAVLRQLAVLGSFEDDYLKRY